MTRIISNTRTLVLMTAAAAALSFSSCDRDDDDDVTPTPQPTSGSVKIDFEHSFNTLPFELGSSNNYVTTNGDTINFSIYKYYISNIKLVRPDGSTFDEAESYHLINAADTNTFKLTLANVPFGNYSGIRFMIGVDSTRNISGAQSGALDPANGMFWTWNSGYIMAKMEGTSPQSGAANNSVVFHIGGFTGANSSLRTVSPTFNGDQATVSATASPEIHIGCNVGEWFQYPTTINLGTTFFQMSVNATSSMIANNYSDMFSVEHIHN